MRPNTLARLNAKRFGLVHPAVSSRREHRIPPNDVTNFAEVYSFAGFAVGKIRSYAEHGATNDRFLLNDPSSPFEENALCRCD